MKTILVAGNPEMASNKREKCPSCGCEFTFDPQTDITFSTNSGIPYGDPYVVCPQEGCGKIVPVITVEISAKLILLKKLLANLGGLL